MSSPTTDQKQTQAQDTVAPAEVSLQKTEAEDAKSCNPEEATDMDQGQQYPPMKKVLGVMVSIYLAFFLVALDRTIIGTAIPTISAQFNSFGDIAWYESAFLLPLCVLQLSFGLVYKYYSTKWTLFTLVAIFEIGSIVCAAAPNSHALIVGRAITGIGGAGIGPGAYLLITRLVPLPQRPKFFGSLGAVFGVSSILGPVLGGYLTAVTWRWCFWINVPIGGVALVLLLLLAPNLAPPSEPATTWRQRFLDLDPVGFLLVAPSLVCLLFALEFGGMGQMWSQGRVIALFVVFAVLLVAFMAYQIWRKDKATIPPRIIGQRSVLVACLFGFAVGSVLVIYAFYLPIWFQVVQGKSPQSSGLSILPLLLSNVFSVIASGILVSVVGYYTPFAMIGAAILVVGTAVLTTWTADISEGKWIGYQILVGVGLGLSLQQPAIAIQTVLSDADMPVGTSLLNFVIFLGGSVFVTVSQALFEQKLEEKLAAVVPGLDTSSLAGSGAGSLRDLVSPDRIDAALAAYNDSMRSIWYLGLGIACLALVASVGFEWKSVKGKTETSKLGDGEAV